MRTLPPPGAARPRARAVCVRRKRKDFFRGNIAPFFVVVSCCCYQLLLLSAVVVGIKQKVRYQSETKSKTRSKMIISKAKKQPQVITALVVIAAGFFLIQLVADKLLTKDEATAPVRSRQMSTLDLPLARSGIAADMLNDEFFSSPFMFDSGLMSIKKEMDRQRDLMLKSMSSSTVGFEKMFEPTYKVKEDADKITFVVSVPDIPLKDIDIEILDGRVMHISGTRKTEKKGVISQTSFDKRFALGRNMDQDNISAKLKGGELTVETPKLKEIEGEKKVKKITIKEEL